MPVCLPSDVALYRARRGPGARLHGHAVVCQWLAWAGTDASLAQVRIVSSTVPGLPCGRVGLVPRARLVPLRRRTPPPGRVGLRGAGPPATGAWPTPSAVRGPLGSSDEVSIAYPTQ